MLTFKSSGYWRLSNIGSNIDKKEIHFNKQPDLLHIQIKVLLKSGHLTTDSVIVENLIESTKYGMR